MPRSCLAVLLAVAACGDGDRPAPPKTTPAPAPAPQKTGIPDRVAYDQILIAFQGSYRIAGSAPGETVLKSDTNRTREAALALAHEVYESARSGTDFEALKREYSDARGPSGEPDGPLKVVRDGLGRAPDEILRSTLCEGASATVFRLAVGEIGIVEHDKKLCPHGWLIIRRLR